jgi:hypothetical protein
MKTLYAMLVILLLLGVLNLTKAQGASSGYGILYSSAITATNDTLQSSWVNIGDASEVWLTFSVNDSANIKFTVNYRTGGDEYASYTDSVFTNSDAGAFIPVLLKGQKGLARSILTQDTVSVLLQPVYINQIPGANYIRLNYFRGPNNDSKINAVTYRVQARLIFKK